MLKVEHLNVFYGITEVLRDVSFEVPAGAIYALLGGNGSGKTTIINSLSGMVKPRKGSISLLGEELLGSRADQMVKAGLVQVPQGREVFYSMTVRENLEMGAATRRGGTEMRSDIEEMYELFPRLAEKRKYMAGSLSGGEQQQVAIARALMSRPQLLLMDEPSVGLSPVVVEDLIGTIKLLNRKTGLTILMVEQNVGVAAAVASQAYVLKDGEIAFSGSAPELIGNPEVLSSYLGR
ncbi:ABC transporter ATP-binding protein [Rhizobium sp. VS19-DR104.2]|uniref:ABC transporter ATP-binding protein n=1 Tax=unclassified Rhizobium TaxID=2613769 RepID=UPI001CC6DBB9|nr:MULTISPECIES: ABC transporter ATP-binding protein [unclassified Rhizobium]MBZ5762228.1 ABC transporter ATP-binding protein [Rhizobium sp. VS19-DR96]MBZ5768244.1 ABC transporter ATP-binding protein [Rhizobium sp. VS19-DR129.2]MBZ5775884.1 ABC transporter ATP-binding protein [Rhizobium sp. VS19-DRK62.2]MBZ5787095.1 ABC transporter ATP-binding protein [Rhizobium sp. VS19-DR121]MBZ5804169.1 ABC transporter ATP-binding protein [Rhizobium sp. VS19-DR181]